MVDGTTHDWSAGQPSGPLQPVMDANAADTVLRRVPRGDSLEQTMALTVRNLADEPGVRPLSRVMAAALERWDLLTFMTSLAAVSEYYRAQGRPPPRAYPMVAAHIRESLRVYVTQDEMANLLRALRPMERARQGLQALSMLAIAGPQAAPALTNVASSAEVGMLAFGHSEEFELDDGEWHVLGGANPVWETDCPPSQVILPQFYWLRTPVPVSQAELNSAEVIDPLAVGTESSFETSFAPPPPELMVATYLGFGLDTMKELAGPLLFDCLGAQFLVATGLGRCLPPHARRIAAARAGLILSKSHTAAANWTTTSVATVARSIGISFCGPTAMKSSNAPALTGHWQLKVFDANGLLRDFYGVAMTCAKPQCDDHAKGWKAPGGSRLLCCPLRHHGSPAMAKAFRLTALHFLKRNYRRVEAEKAADWKGFGSSVRPDSAYGNGGPTNWWVQDILPSDNPQWGPVTPVLRWDHAHVDWGHLQQFG